MNTKTVVADVMEALELATDESSSYIHRPTGRVVTITRDDLHFAEDEESDVSDLPEWQQEVIAEAREVLASEEWLPLPGKFDLHEWKIMDDFGRTIADLSARDELADAVRGRGAFRKFKDAIRRLGVEDAWYAYKATALDRVAREWLSENGFEMTDLPLELTVPDSGDR